MKMDIGYALLATQSALLGIVTPELRAVSVDLDAKKEVFYIIFFHEGEISEEIKDLWECSITEASASLGPKYFTEGQIVRLDFPKKIPLKGRFAFLRKE